MKKTLVTGGTGFLGLQIIKQLLERDYDVRTTIRKPAGKERILKVLRENKVHNLNNLSFIEADLSSDNHWVEAMSDRETVFSVAAPVFFEQPKNELDAIRPAIDGTMRILKAAAQTDVKKVVMTSNFGAVGFSKKSGLTTEADWTDPNEVGLSLYEKSKLLAEQAAWKYVKQPEVNLELTTINPAAIYGASLDAHVSGSFELLENLLNGKMSRIPNLSLNVVDVKDVALMQILAMESPKANGQRFIATDDGEISLYQIAELIKNKRPQLAGKVSTKRLPNWLLDLAAHFNQTAKEGKLLKDINRNVSNQKARELLNWQPSTNSETTVLEAIDSLNKYHEI